MNDRPSKLAKINSLRKNIPHCSKSALHKILEHIKDEGLPEMTQPKQMTEGCQAVVDSMDGYGPLLLHHQLVTTSKQKKTVTLVNFLSWVHGAYKAGGGFWSLLKATLQKHSGPMSLLVYADEITPGNVLAHQPARKVWCLYVTLKEFHTAIQSEHAWATVGLIRSTTVASLDGHLSQVCAALLTSIFQSDYANVTELGIQLQEPLGQAPVGKRLKLQLGFFIMDGQAAKFAWSTKGDSGSRFCQQCANVFQLADDDGSHENESEVSKFTQVKQLHLVQRQEIFDSWDRMEDRHSTLTKKAFEQWEQATGITFSPYSLLACRPLRGILDPTTQNTWDYMHCLLSNGVLSIAMFKWLELLDQWDLLAGYVHRWLLPKSLGGIKLAPLLEQKRLHKHKAHGKMNATASELLTLCNVLAHFARTVVAPSGSHKAETELLLALVLLLDLLQATWHGKVQPIHLQHSAEDCLQRWVKLNWKMVKKHHWLLHFHSMLKHHQIIPSCFCMERKNKIPSRIATGIQNLKTFEHSLYLEIISWELEKVKDPDVFATGVAVLTPKPCGKKLLALAATFWTTVESVSYSNHARVQYGNCSKGDVVYFASSKGHIFDAGEVMVFFSNQNQEVAIVNVFTLAKQFETFAEWQEADNIQAINLKHMWAAVIHSHSSQKITTLTPWHFR